jgi:hypothetical protein
MQGERYIMAQEAFRWKYCHLIAIKHSKKKNKFVT